jgi:hypothetical protein
VANLRRLAWVVVAASVTALGCYSPRINPGGFRCGDAGVCPDKFRCAADHRCYPDDKDASLDLPVDKQPVCTSPTSITTPLCSTEPVSPQQCDPGCQTGCLGCGWCSVVGGTSKCLTGTAGTADVGDPCDPTNVMSCKAGLYCQPECSATTGRCYRFCDDDNGCATGSKCNVAAKKSATAATQFKLCSLGFTCTVLPQSGCPSGLDCYPVSMTQNECDCPGIAAVGDSCVGTPDCQPGSFCVGPKGATTCHQACDMANGNADCTTGTCNSSGTLYGYCM